MLYYIFSKQTIKKTMLNLPIFRIYVDSTVDGVEKISLVHSPAVESNFLAFSEDDKKKKAFKFEADEDQHIVFGCSLRADFPIYRREGDFEYYVIFDKQAIKDIVEKFAKNGNFNNVNLDHKDDTDGIYMTQMFIKDSEKGVSPVGFEDIEEGSLFTQFKIENEDVWEKVKDGTYLAFSVEGIFKLDEIKAQQQMEAQNDPYTEYINELIK